MLGGLVRCVAADEKGHQVPRHNACAQHVVTHGAGAGPLRAQTTDQLFQGGCKRKTAHGHMAYMGTVKPKGEGLPPNAYTYMGTGGLTPLP